MTEAASRTIQIEASWLARLTGEFQQPYMKELRAFLVQEKKAGKSIYPQGAHIFNAFAKTPFDKVKVIILGQDPYHGPGQAHGLCFSVPQGVRPPPSLLNIFKEIEQDLKIELDRKNGHLLPWAAQGVLLLNSVLTVEQASAASHRERGWERFTDRVIEELNQGREGLVFLLWGSYAQRKGKIVDRRRHLVLEAPHPSPMSAERGFFGCQHFSRANTWLQEQGLGAVDWSLPLCSGAEAPD